MSFKKWSIAGASVLGLAAAEHIAGRMLYSGEVKAIAHRAECDANDTIVLLAGFVNSGPAVLATLVPKLQQFANVVVVRYADARFSAEETYQAIMSTMQAHGWHNPSFFGGSLGGLLAAEIACIYHADGEPFGRVRLLVVDNSQSSVGSLKLPSMLLRACSLLQYAGPATGLAQKAILTWWFRFMVPRADDPEVDQDLIEAHIKAMINYPITGAGAELRYMLEADVAGLSIASAVGKLVFVTGPHMASDPLVDNEAAIKGWRRVFPNVQVAIDYARGPGEHNTVAGRPQFVADTLAKHLG